MTAFKGGFEAIYPLHHSSVAGFRVQGSEFRVQGSGFRFGVQSSGFRVQGSGFRVQGPGFRVRGSGFRSQCLWSLPTLRAAIVSTRCRANMAHIRQMLPDSGPGWQVTFSGLRLHHLRWACWLSVLFFRPQAWKPFKLLSLRSAALLPPDSTDPPPDCAQSAGCGWSLFVSLSLPAPLSLSRARSILHIHTHTHTRSLSLSLSLYLSIFLSFSLSLSISHTLSLSLSLTHTPSLACLLGSLAPLPKSGARRAG